MTLTREQREFIERIDNRRLDTGHTPSAADIMVAGQFVGIDFPSEESVEEFLCELRK